MILNKKPFEDIVRTGGNAGILHFCQFSHCFLPFPKQIRVPRGSEVRCLTRKPGVMGSSLTRSSGFFHGSVLGQDTSEPSLVLVKPRKA